ncbi:MAG: glycerophosphodiester phosphodiesterase [Spirochaetia bacterium]|jgi:glycerophosphoryl diester phosphodiesterase|nr:glycerophosphodiester phosphodiesterase [Spirochaetia bacterium]
MNNIKDSRPLLYGHRGLSTLAPENTLTAFGLCLEHRIHGIELDVHRVKTGEIVVVHDSNLQRVSGKNLIVEDLTLDEIKSLDVGLHKGKAFKGETIPLLGEVFDLCKDSVTYDIELKSPKIYVGELAKSTYEIIKSHGLVLNCTISSFNPFALRAFEKTSNYSFRDAVIFSNNREVPWLLRKGFGRHLCHCSYLKPEHIQVTEKFMEKMSVDDYDVVCWTVDDPTEAKRVVNLGVSGVISNNPLLLQGTGLFR